LFVGAGHAREQKGAGIGAFLVPEHKVARMAASYKARPCPRIERSRNRRLSGSRAQGRPHGGFMPSGAPTAGFKVARMAALCPWVLLQPLVGAGHARDQGLPSEEIASKARSYKAG